MIFCPLVIFHKRLSMFDVFRIIRLTDLEEPIITSSSPLNFVYDNLPQELLLSEEERQTLNSIVQISHLFDISEFDEEEALVRFFGIDIEANKSDRSQIQCIIYDLIAREAAFCSVILFRCDRAVSVSMAFQKPFETNTAYLSDWFKLSSNKIDCFFISLGTATFSLTNGIDFIVDFAYSAYEYYIHEYLQNKSDSDDAFEGYLSEKDDDDVDMYIETQNKKTISTSKIDFDLIEYKLEQMGLLDLAVEEKSVDDELSQLSTTENIENDNTLEEIPKDILADPIKLLKWLDEHSPGEPSNVKPNA